MAEREQSEEAKGKSLPILVHSLGEKGTPFFFVARLLQDRGISLTGETARLITFSPQVQRLQSMSQGYGEPPEVFSANLAAVDDPLWDSNYRTRIEATYHINRSSRTQALATITRGQINENTPDSIRVLKEETANTYEAQAAESEKKGKRTIRRKRTTFAGL